MSVACKGFKNLRLRGFPQESVSTEALMEALDDGKIGLCPSSSTNSKEAGEKFVPEDGSTIMGLGIM